MLSQDMCSHLIDVIDAMTSQIASPTIVYSTVYSGADQRKHQSSASLAFVQGIHRWPMNSPHKWPVTRKMFPLDDVINENIKLLLPILQNLMCVWFYFFILNCLFKFFGKDLVSWTFCQWTGLCLTWHKIHTVLLKGVLVWHQWN